MSLLKQVERSIYYSKMFEMLHVKKFYSFLCLCSDVALFAAGCQKLKRLLSFAIGGLLGDVFLHLLPEAWAYTSSPGENSHVIYK